MTLDSLKMITNSKLQFLLFLKETLMGLKYSDLSVMYADPKDF